MSKVTSVLNRLEQAQRDADEIEIGDDGTALDLLRKVYRNSALPLTTRMRAAAIAIPFESPKLAVIAKVGPSDFATKLEARRQQRIERMRLIAPIPVEEGTNVEVADGTMGETISPRLDSLKRVTDPARPFSTFRRRI